MESTGHIYTYICIRDKKKKVNKKSCYLRRVLVAFFSVAAGA